MRDEPQQMLLRAKCRHATAHKLYGLTTLHQSLLQLEGDKIGLGRLVGLPLWLLLLGPLRILIFHLFFFLSRCLDIW